MVSSGERRPEPVPYEEYRHALEEAKKLKDALLWERAQKWYVIVIAAGFAVLYFFC